MKKPTTFLSLLLIAAILVISGCKERKYAYTSVPSEAMAPTIVQGTVVKVDFNAYKHGKPVERWDIVGIKMHGNVIIKRVIGLGGETLEIKPNGKTIIIDGKPILVPDFIPWQGKKLQKSPSDNPVIGVKQIIPQGAFFVIDDNIDVNSDSRMFGAVPRKYLTGKVILSKSNRKAGYHPN